MFPAIFGKSIFDDFFDFPFGKRTASNSPSVLNSAFSNFNMLGGLSSDMMRTDIKKSADGYEMIIDLPGIKKENITCELNDGYLTISANASNNNEKKNDDGEYLYRERYDGSFSRSFYVGNALKQEDIKARFDNGTLHLNVPEKKELPQIEQRNYIPIK